MEHNFSSLEYEQLKKQLDAQDITIREIRDALLGSLANKSSGLLEGHRLLRNDVDNILTVQRTNVVQINELTKFKGDIKKIVMGIAFAIPFFFEIIKLGIQLAWDWLRHSK